MEHQRYSLDELKIIPDSYPKSLDFLEFEFRGVTFRCFGILHGITGGMNQKYVEFIKTSCNKIEGIKLAEKGMKQLYRNCGIEEELEDWMVLRNIDCLVMGFQLIADPRCLWMITIDAIREKLRKLDPYLTNNRSNISDLGESPYFHYIDEFQRRNLIGFMPSTEAITKDLQSMRHLYGAIKPRKRHIPIKHPQWSRILLLERVMHIPCRSVHMLHYGLSYAKKHNHKLINILVGETHNTDMCFLANNYDKFFESLDSRSRSVMLEISDRANHYGGNNGFINKLTLLSKKANYILFLLIGAATPLCMYIVLFSWIGFI